MNIKQIEKTIPYLLKHKIVPFLWGNQGIGKTQVTKQIASALGYRMICLNLATQDIGDLIGLLLHMGDGTVAHARPSWFPVAGEQKAVVFLDEFNRAHPDVIQAMYPFLQTGTLHKHQLPNDCRIVVAGNYQNENFSVSEVLSEGALMSRFCHVDFRPTVEEFTAYADKLEAKSISDFISTMPAMLEEEVKVGFNFSTLKPNRRAYLDSIRLLEEEVNIESERYEIYQGLIGTTAAAAFETWKTTKQEAIKYKHVLDKYAAVRDKVIVLSKSNESRLDVLNSCIDGIIMYVNDKKHLTPEQMENLKSFILDIPQELGNSFVDKIAKTTWPQKNDIINNKQFVERFVKTRNEKEAA